MSTKFTFFAAILSLTFMSLQGQDWPTIGNRIIGDAAGDEAGFSVSLSGDGTIVAVGIRNNDENGSNSGMVRIYIIQGDSWEQVGSTIYGEAEGEYFGRAVSLNNDGTIVAVGAPFNNDSGEDAGCVRVFRYVGDDWVQSGGNIYGEAEGDFSGSSVSLSSNGSIVAIGAPYNDGNDLLNGQVRIYENQNGTWEQVGDDIDGEASWDFAGSSVSLNDDGTIVAIGLSMLNPSCNIRIFENHSGNWEQLGNSIHGVINTGFGVSVDLNSSGTVIAIGSTYGSAITSGMVQIFEDQDGSWVQLGSDIYGVATDDQFGTAVSLNSDGTVMAAGALTNDGNGAEAGMVRVFRLTNGEWMQKGNDMIGSRSGSFLGLSVSLSRNGAVVAAGAPGSETDSGYVQVYGNLFLPEIETQPEDQTGICPGTDVAFSVDAVDDFYYQWQVSKDIGTSWINLTDGDVYSNTETDVLSISSVITGMNNYRYRCIIGNLAGNSISNSASIVLETTLPEITCPGDLSAYTGEEDTYTVSGNEFDADAVDNCSMSSLVNSYNMTSTLAGEVFPVGTYPISWMACDIAGNINGCTSDLTVYAGTGVPTVNETDIVVFPNPSKGEFEVVSDMDELPLLFELFDLNESLFLSRKLTENHSFITVDPIVKGLYFFRITGRFNTHGGKLVIE